VGFGVLIIVIAQHPKLPHQGQELRPFKNKAINIQQIAVLSLQNLKNSCPQKAKSKYKVHPNTKIFIHRANKSHLSQ